MEPVAAMVGRKGWRIRHRCRECGHESVNRAAVSETWCPDDARALGRLSALA